MFHCSGSAGTGIKKIRGVKKRKKQTSHKEFLKGGVRAKRRGQGWETKPDYERGSAGGLMAAEIVKNYSCPYPRRNGTGVM